VKFKLIAFTVDTLEQAENVIIETKNYNIKPILHFKSYIIEGFGSEFILNFQNMLTSKFGKNSFKFYVDCGFNNGLSINMASKKIEYIKLRGNSIILSKIKNITSKNRVLLNPSFNIIDFRNRKKIHLKIKKLYSKDNNEN
jgi:hypothetical protein